MKAYLCHSEHFMEKLNGSDVCSLLLSNNREHMPICAKTISSWVRKVWVLHRQMSPSTPQGAILSVALVAGVSLVSILQAGGWVSFYPS